MVRSLPLTLFLKQDSVVLTIKHIQLGRDRMAGRIDQNPIQQDRVDCSKPRDSAKKCYGKQS